MPIDVKTASPVCTRMLVGAFIVTLLSLAIAKCVIIYGASHEDCYLRRIAIMQCLQDRQSSGRGGSQSFKQKCKEFLTVCPDEYWRNMLCRKMSPTLFRHHNNYWYDTRWIIPSYHVFWSLLKNP